MRWPADWAERTIGSLADARGGVGFPLALQGRCAGELPFYKVSDMNADGNTTWMRRANNYISQSDLRELGGRAFDRMTIVFPKVGATIYTDKKRILATTAVVDNNVMGVTVTDVACLPEFLFFWFQHIELAKLSSPGTVPSITSSRVKAQKIMLPPVDEQQRIAAVMSAEQRAIERQERLIALTAELKKALMHKLFTEGTRGEPLKQTEIGAVPESWTVDRLDSFCILQRGFDITKNEQTDGRVPVVSSGGIKSYHNTAKVQGPGVIVGRKGTLGTVHYVEEPYWPHDTTLWVKDFRGNHPRFTAYFLDRLDFARFDSGASNPTLNRNTVHSETVASPPREQQLEIASILSSVERKGDLHMRSKASLHSLFRTLLHQLMTAQIRIHDLDLFAMGPEDAAQPAGAA